MGFGLDSDAIHSPISESLITLKESIPLFTNILLS
jgi:hypothetical protein